MDSMPVTWDELSRALKRDKTNDLYFDPKVTLARLDNVGDLFADVLTVEQFLPADLTQAIEQQNRREGRTTKNLREYERKRHFSATPEPVASALRRSAQGSRRRFVVQKHATSHLHYDFRLEIHDTLKSWAVPKGIPYELGVRRLASATEDHPLEYLIGGACVFCCILCFCLLEIRLPPDPPTVQSERFLPVSAATAESNAANVLAPVQN